MKMNTKERKDLALSKIILVVAAAAALIMVVWLAWLKPGADADPVTSYQACVDAGNPVQESYPETCVTPNGQRFTNPEQHIQQLAIEEWNVHTQLTNVNDAYYTYNAADDTATVSTVTLDNTIKEITGCKSGLRPLIYDRAKPGDINPDTNMPWTEAELQNRGTKAGDYYYFEKSVIETLCLPDGNDQHVKKAQDLVNTIRSSMRGITQE